MFLVSIAFSHQPHRKSYVVKNCVVHLEFFCERNQVHAFPLIESGSLMCRYSELKIKLTL